MNHITSRLLGSLLLCAVAFLAGCATPSDPTAMVVSTADFGRQHPHSVSVNVVGGRETSKAGASQISDQDFRSAVVRSIEQSRLFEQVLAPDSADYHLEILIARLDQPMFGFNMTVTIETSWTLTRRDSGDVVWEKTIPTSHTAKAGEAFSGVKRLRLANEGAAQANIEEALKELAQLRL